MSLARSEDIQQRLRIFEPEVDFWIREHGLPENEKTQIMEIVRDALEHDKESFHLQKLRSLLVDRIERIKGNFSDDEVQKVNPSFHYLVTKPYFNFLHS